MAGRVPAWQACAYTLLMIRTTAQAQAPPGPLPIEALLIAPRLAPVGTPSVSSDGRLIAYTVVVARDRATTSHAGVPWYSVGGHIWLSPMAGGPPRRITAGTSSSWSPAWSPDGRRLAFLSSSSRAGAGIGLWIWERSTGDLRQVRHVRALDPWARLGRLEWLGDSRTVVMKAYPAGSAAIAYEAALAKTGWRPPRPESGVATVELYRYDPRDQDRGIPGANNLDALVGDLVLTDIETGRVMPIAQGVRLCTYALSPDRTKVAWAVATRFQRPESYQVLVDLFVHDLTTRRSWNLVRGVPLIAAYPTAPVFSWAPSSQAIAYRTNGPGAKREEVYVASLSGSPAKRLAVGPARDHTFEDQRPLWTADASTVIFARDGALLKVKADGTEPATVAATSAASLRMLERGSGTLWLAGDGRGVVVTGDRASKRMGFALVDLQTGTIAPLLEEAKWYDTTLGSPPVVMPDGRSVVFVASEAREPADLWFARLERSLRPRRITQVAPKLGRFSGGVAQAIEWRGLDGDTLHGALIHPAGYRRGTRYPLIVQVYGGTSVSDDLNRFGSALDPVENVQVLASRGYAVLLADSRIRVGTPMLDLVKTVLPGVDRAIELGVADPGRLGIMGHSYGGYSALSLLVQSRRFKGAIMRAGFGDLLGLYSQLSPDGRNHNVPWAEEGQGSMGGTPWELRERYLENSPVMYLDRIDTPLLIIHGAEDRTVGSFLADAIFVGLRRLGRRVDYARYGGEEHWEAGWSLANQLDYLNRVIAWFDQYVKGANGTPPTTDAR